MTRKNRPAPVTRLFLMAGHLLDNLLLFGRVLRGLGLDVSPGRMVDLAAALDHIDIGRRDDFYHAARTLLVHGVEDLAVFDQAFTLFWRRPSERWEVRLPPADPLRRRRSRLIAPTPQPPATPEGAADVDEPPAFDVTMTYSAVEILRHKDFSELSADEVAAVKTLIANLEWRLDERRTRRLTPGAGARLDLRRTIRRSLKHGGEIVEWAERRRKTRPRPLVVLADISGSMERYTRLLLHFLFGLSIGLDQRVETFVFGTRLTRITRQLKHKQIDTALRDVSTVVTDWAGGTRIGDCLKRFNFDWGRRVLGRGAVVLVISDGWDRGDPEVLGHEIARLHRSAQRLIWLNPLLGAADYEPLTRGLQAALPHIDDFLPVHNLASLEALAERLGEIR